jgi:hypothetical protein
MTAFINFAKNSAFFGRFLSEKSFPKQFVEGASLVVTVHLGTSLPYVRTSSTIMSQSGGLDHVAYSLMDADETNNISSLNDDETYSVTPYVMARLTMGTRLSKSHPIAF